MEMQLHTAVCWILALGRWHLSHHHGTMLTTASLPFWKSASKRHCCCIRATGIFHTKEEKKRNKLDVLNICIRSPFHLQKKTLLAKPRTEPWLGQLGRMTCQDVAVIHWLASGKIQSLEHIGYSNSSSVMTHPNIWTKRFWS